MIIQRDRYLQKLIHRRENGMVKVITGIRRCGKSYLLFELYHQYLNSEGVTDDHIIELALDEDVNARYRNPVELGQYIRSLLVDQKEMYFIFLDEIQKVVEVPNPFLPGTDEKIGFVDVLLGLMKIKNVDLYVTGSIRNSILPIGGINETRGDIISLLAECRLCWNRKLLRTRVDTFTHCLTRYTWMISCRGTTLPTRRLSWMICWTLFLLPWGR